ncbi:MAG: hypothetical protein COT73_05345 [Bdellovibrio sp. CG10_big_fil_rev_8_21_14_0_10_47_8]|nr:MAG: hypothetical protein COT73_05345 [Bdellovibrio sp. CG10_big_fil_rev_8_21_14_0_10_47_8]
MGIVWGASTKVLVFSVVLNLTSVIAYAQVSDTARWEAKRILERISSTKVSADHPLIEPMALMTQKGDYLGAAQLATTDPNFLGSTVKLMGLKMSTRDETFRQPLNDFAAMVVGVTRDDLDARLLLTGNFYYQANPSKIPAGVTVRSDMANDLLKSNNHYQDLDRPSIDIDQVLMRVDGQKLLDGQNAVVNNPDPAGVITSRAFIVAHASDGTNRRPIEFTFREFMCVPIQEWADTKVSDQRIGRDIDRFPGGDHLKFQTTCKGCHTQMDSLRGAFAMWDVTGNRAVNGAMTNRAGSFDNRGIARKMNKNGDVYAGGFVMTDNSFINNSRGPANAEIFGWRGDVDAGQGVQQLGQMVANSKRFSQCMVKRVYDAVCRTQLDVKNNLPFLSQQALDFERNNYNIKSLFEKLVILKDCSGI